MGWGFITHHQVSEYIPVMVMLTIQVRFFHAFFPVGLGGGEMQDWK